MGYVRQKLGENLRAQTSLSPTSVVESMILMTWVTIPPIPPNTKWKKIVTVCATFSEEKRNEVT